MSGFTYDWTRFEREFFIRAEPEAVFRAWAVPENIVKWFIASAEYVAADNTPRQPGELVAPGDTYHWEWHQDLSSRGTILEVVENERLVFTFGDKEPGSDEKIIVTVEVSLEEDGVTLLRLVQENMADTPQAHVSWHMQCNLGWSFFMTNLKGLLEYGADLRETDRERAYAARAVTH
jgi:uncharacterized protein YndB with AHSA1/START domain